MNARRPLSGESVQASVLARLIIRRLAAVVGAPLDLSKKHPAPLLPVRAAGSPVKIPYTSPARSADYPSLTQIARNHPVPGRFTLRASVASMHTRSKGALYAVSYCTRCRRS